MINLALRSLTTPHHISAACKLTGAVTSLCTAASFSTTHPPASGPLTGIRVLDLGQVVAGNFAGSTLAYFGADVIKVEPPGKGDALRSLRMLENGTSGNSLWWRVSGRNRRCITANLHMPEGREIVKQLSSHADVLLENFRPGVMEKWGLGPVDLKQSLVYTRISGYGQTGPRSLDAGYASVCEAYGGFRSLNGFPDRPSVRPNLSLGDTLAGLHAAFGTVMALLHKQRMGSGQQAKGFGQVVDASISESVFNMLESCITEVVEAGVTRGPSGSTISDVVPSGTFPTKSGKHVIIGGNGDSVYSRLMTAIGRPDMTAENPQFATNNDRCKHMDLIMSEIAKYCAEHTIDEVVVTMSAARVPCGPILTVADILEEDHYKARGMFEKASPLKGGREMTVPAMLPVLSKTPGRTRWTGPDLGEHTEEVLKGELGYSDQRIAELKARGAI